jgi:hypothetical protein
MEKSAVLAGRLAKAFAPIINTFGRTSSISLPSKPPVAYASKVLLAFCLVRVK